MYALTHTDHCYESPGIVSELVICIYMYIHGNLVVYMEKWEIDYDI